MGTNIQTHIRVDSNSWFRASPLRFLTELAAGLADFVFPPFCSCCHQRMPSGQRQPICEDCWQRAELWNTGACQRCGGSIPVAADPRLCSACQIEDWACSDVRTAGPFRGTVAEAVHLLKYSERRSIARRLAGLMAESLAPSDHFRQADLITAVPLHRARLRERGYNQAQLLAEELSRIVGVPGDFKAVFRIRHNQTQTKLNRKQRQENVRNIFRSKDHGRVRGKRVILVDDVLTTGATIGACARALLEAGAAEVLAMAVAAAPLD